MSLQNIFIAGAAKSGTTTLYYLLNQHPHICFPIVKEPNYFNNGDLGQDITGPGRGPGDRSTVWTNTRKGYETLYRCNSEHRYRLDASVSYLYSTKAACRISEYSTDAKIIIVLRNPVDRAWSHYKHLVRDGRENLSFKEALKQEEERIVKGWEFSWHLKRMGLYSQQVQRFYEHFDTDQILIFLFEDITNDLEKTINEIASFASLPAFQYNFKQKKDNVSGVVKSKTFAGIINWIVGYKSTVNKIIPPRITHRLMQLARSFNIKQKDMTMPSEIKQGLQEYFREDIEETGELIGRDLSHWLN